MICPPPACRFPSNRASFSLLLALLASPPAPAQDFGDQQLISAGTAIRQPSSIDAADLDGNGAPDLLVSSLLLRKVGWIPNQGGGAFQDFDFAATNPYLASCTAEDLDADGDFDILILSEVNGDYIRWAENLGGGVFTTTKAIASGVDNPTFAAGHDLDGDGDLDVVAVSGMVSGDIFEVAWYENLGGGSFGGKQVFFSGTSSSSDRVDVGDLDGDGDLDVVYDLGQDIIWHEALGGGTFMPGQVIYTGAGYISDLTLGDADGDSDLDIFCLENPDLVWIENQGSGAFAAGQVITTQVSQLVNIEVSDVDLDGDNDVFSCSKDDDRLTFHENLGAGTFAPESVIASQLGSPKGVTLADYDGDGDIDAATASGVNDSVSWFENLGGGTFGGENVLVNPPEAQGARFLSEGDLDQDGDIDVVCSNITGGEVCWYENLGDGTFGIQVVVGANLVGWEVRSVDLDEDGDLDLLWGSLDGAGGVVTWFENQGGASFGPGTVLDTGSGYVTGLDVADLDGDGLLDIVAAWLNASEVVWYRGTGSGNYSARQVIGTGVVAPVDAHAHDVDLDGDLDVFTNSIPFDQVIWYENLGGGTFSPNAVVATDQIDGCVDLHIADLDGDGIKDLIASGVDLSELSWFRGTGSGSGFGAEQSIFIGYQVYKTETVDLDDDGDLDLICAEDDGNTISWYENLGGGLFSDRMLVTPTGSAVGARGVKAADLDGDGDPDVISASEFDSKIAWYENLMAVDCGTRYCGADQNPNNASGIGINSCNATSNAIKVSLYQGPPNQFIYLLVGNGSATVNQPPGAKGDLCVVGGSCLGRYDKDVGQIGTDGIFVTDVVNANSNPCQGAVVITVGSTWNFQYWHRQPMGQPATFSEAISVTFQ